MFPRLLALLFLPLVMLLAACSSQSRNLAENPLIGQFWSIPEQTFLTLPEVFERLPVGGWVLLGNQFGHAYHLQTEMAFLQLLADTDKLGKVAVGRLSYDVQLQLDAAWEQGTGITAEDLDWTAGRHWQYYGPLIQESLTLAQGVVATELVMDDIKQAYRGRVTPRGEFSPQHSVFKMQQLNRDLCYRLRKHESRGMLYVLLARDQMMARKLMENRLPDKVGLFVADTNHARRDHGVPLWLDADVPRLSILLQEVGSSARPQDYLKRTFDRQWPADLVYFVPAVPDFESCPPRL